MSKLAFIFLGLITCGSFSIAQAPYNTPDNTGSGNGLSFDGINDYVEIDDHTTLNFGTGDFSIECWVKTSSGLGNILEKDQNGGANASYLLKFRTGNKLGFMVGTSGGDYFAVSQTSFTDGEWHHVAGVRHSGAANGVKIYVDGVLEGTTTDNGGSVDNNEQLFIGISNAVNGPFNGYIDEVRIWNMARTASQIRENMCQSLRGNETGLVAYWNMNEGQDNSCSTTEDVCDLTGNGNHGTLQ